jgi:Do/DeqQ family serine protease
VTKFIYYFGLLIYLLTFTVNSSTTLSTANNRKTLSTLAPLVEKVTPAVVNISVLGQQYYSAFSADSYYFFNPDSEQEILQQPFFGLGSGVIIDADRGYIITNYHVIEDATEIKVSLKSGREFIARTIGMDKESDIALLQINSTEKLIQLELADSDKLRVGDFVLAIGNPFGLGQTVTSGIISALGRSGLNLDSLENFIQTDAAINTGNSGGALVDLQGKLIGINTAILGPNGDNIGIGFAIPSNMVADITRQLLLYGEIRRGILGIRGRELTPELATIFNLDSPNGAFITQVTANSAAEEAGVKAGDIIVSANNTTVNSFAELRAQVASLTIGSKVRLGIIRNGKRITLNAVLKESQQQIVSPQSFHPSLSGCTLMNNINNKGVTIIKVQPDSIAEGFGLQEGDLIIDVNQTTIHNLDDLSKLLNSSKNLLAIKILRNKRPLYLILD